MYSEIDSQKGVKNGNFDAVFLVFPNFHWELAWYKSSILLGLYKCFC